MRRAPWLLRRQAPPEPWPDGDTHTAWQSRRPGADDVARERRRLVQPAPVVRMAPGAAPRVIGTLPPVRLAAWLDVVCCALALANLGVALALLGSAG